MTTSRLVQRTISTLDVNEWVDRVTYALHNIVDSQPIPLTLPVEEWTDIRVTNSKPNLWGYRPFDCGDAEWLDSF